MRIGIDLSPLSYGNRTRGIGTYAENLVAALAATDTTNEYVLLCLRGDDSDSLPSALPSNFSIVSLGAPPLGRAQPLVSHQLVLPFRARALQLDLLHLVDVPFNPSHPSVSYWQPVPTVVTVFDLIPLRMASAILKHSRYHRFYQFQLNACRRAAHLLTTSEQTARDLAQYAIAPRAKISVTPLAAPALDNEHPVSNPVRARIANAPFFLHVGGNEPQKNQQTVLRAFGMLCRNPAFRHHLVLVGAAHWDDMPALEMSTRAALRIIRLTDVTRADLDALYAHCDAFVFPSLYEGFGLPVLEAMRAGAPVVTSNLSSLPEVAGDAALLIDPKDANAIANALRRTLDDERLRIKLSESGERRAQEFTWERTATLTRAVYERIARHSPNARI